MIRMTKYSYDDNDDMAPVMDAVLLRIGAAVSYGKDDEDEWITLVNHQDMEDALRDMAPRERAIIRKFFLEKKTLLDISEDLGIPMPLVGGYIRAMKARINIWL